MPFCRTFSSRGSRAAIPPHLWARLPFCAVLQGFSYLPCIKAGSGPRRAPCSRLRAPPRRGAGTIRERPNCPRERVCALVSDLRLIRGPEAIARAAGVRAQPCACRRPSWSPSASDLLASSDGERGSLCPGSRSAQGGAYGTRCTPRPESDAGGGRAQPTLS
jgi:hypothetical protein